ncbi:MAG TPA: AarF/ABC1/UbiB kinase family protein [Acidimicrobiia bacterium]|nr:AarF/ABC1/UbiB kinase family protein [Acidimicrobiia bacterium]
MAGRPVRAGRRWRTPLVLATGAVVLGLAIRAGRRGDGAGRAGGPIRFDSRLARNAELTRVGAKAGGSFAVHRARRTFASAERREVLDREHEMKTAEQIAEALGHMKGALMKLGQMASYLDQGLPEPVREALAQLQQDAPPMSAELAAGVITAELGRSPEEIFEQWDPVPIASASIGQVHRAITRDGRAVAVKVQYPGIDQAIRADLDNVDFLFTLMGMLFPGMDPGPIVEELRERLLEEIDYGLEADNQRLFVDYYRDHPHIHVPEVVDELSTARVLTTELAAGARFDEVRGWSPEERNLAAETIYRFVFGSIYRLGVFNGDPHPGNYLFEPGGRVTFLDYGLVKHFEDEIAIFEDLIDTMVLAHDPPAFRRILEDVGLMAAGLDVTDEQVIDYFSHFYELVMTEGEVLITPEYASESVRRYFDLSGPHADIMKSANLPPGFVIIQRINLGLNALFAELGATGNWRRLAEEIWPRVEAAPSTPLGEAHAAWKRAGGGQGERPRPEALDEQAG